MGARDWLLFFFLKAEKTNKKIKKICLGYRAISISVADALLANKIYLDLIHL